MRDLEHDPAAAAAERAVHAPVPDEFPFAVRIASGQELPTSDVELVARACPLDAREPGRHDDLCFTSSRCRAPPLTDRACRVG